MTPSISSNNQQTMRYRVAAVLFWLLLWQLAARLVGHEFLLASPLAVLKSLVDLVRLPGTWLAILRSLSRILLGFVLGALLGAVLASLCSRSQFLKELFAPLIAAARAAPVASFTILAIILVSTTWLSTLIALVIGFPVVYAQVTEGIARLDTELNEMADVFGAQPFKRFFYLRLPQMLPFLRAGLVTAAGLCWKSGVAAEVIGIPKGTIGEKLYSVKVNYYTADLFAWTILIILMSLLTVRLVGIMLSALERGIRR